MSIDESAPLWFGRERRRKEARITLFCLPFGGGGSSIYSSWHELFPPEIEVCPIRLPGRERRIDEPAAISVKTIAQVLADRIDLPFALYGHSMGGLLGFEVLRALQDLRAPAALRFYPAAGLPPHLSSALYECVLLPD